MQRTGLRPSRNRGGEKAELRSLAVALDRHAPPLTLMLGLILEGNKEAAPGKLRVDREGVG